MISGVPPVDRTPDTDDWGVDVAWIDARDDRRTVSADSLAALREVIGVAPPDLDETGPLVTRPGLPLARSPRRQGEPATRGRAAVVECEDGRERPVDLSRPLPRDFPTGYHWLRTPGGSRRRLIVSPGRCWLPEGWRAWGWAAQLYAARSSDSWGIGDLADLRWLREWSEGLGAGFMLINPLHAVAPTFPQEASPYLPVTRRFRNPVYLHVEDVPGADAAAIGPLIERGRGLNARPTIDRDDVWRLKLEALRTVRGLGVARERFDAWRRSQGRALEDFCRWAAVAVVHGGDWREWDAGLRDPASAAVAAFADRNRGEVDFQAWLQWALDEQLHAATGDLTVLQDLPIGVHGGGADSWVWQDAFAHGVRVGAPPDLYSTFGQDWGSPPLIPWRLRELDYEPFIQAIRATVSGAGGLRIDHVMGLFRLWWVPEGATPAGGAYVRYPSVDLLDIVALESQRARAVVVGEDLGTVEAGVREALSEHDMLSYRVLWFERDPARRWPAKSMAAVATHDLPTVAGLWGDTDSVDRRRHTREPAEAIASQRATLLDALTTRGGLDADLDPAEAVVQAYGLLGQAPSTLLSATLDDAVAAERRPNIPGAIDRENWRIPLPMPLERIAAEPTAQRVAAVLRSAVSRLGPG